MLSHRQWKPLCLNCYTQTRDSRGSLDVAQASFHITLGSDVRLSDGLTNVGLHYALLRPQRHGLQYSSRVAFPTFMSVRVLCPFM